VTAAQAGDTSPVGAAVTGAWAAARLPASWDWEIQECERAARIGLSVTRHAVLVITVPADATPERVAMVVRGKARWIAHYMIRAIETRPDYKVAQITGGEGFRWLGYSSRLSILSGDRLAAAISETRRNVIAGTPGMEQPWFERDGQHWLRLPASLSQGQVARDAIIGLYRSAGAAFATGRVYGNCAAGGPVGNGDPLIRLARLGLAGNPPAIDVADTGTEWVTYQARTHTISLHWAVFQLNLSLVDYLITQGLVWATRPGSKYGPQFRRHLTGIHHILEPIERQLTEDTRYLWMGEIR